MLIKNCNVKPATSHTGVTLQTTLIKWQTLTFKITPLLCQYETCNYNTITMFVK
jgi:hypothetical protein